MVTPLCNARDREGRDAGVDTLRTRELLVEGAFVDMIVLVVSTKGVTSRERFVA
jgi:hypothetical protein